MTVVSFNEYDEPNTLFFGTKDGETVLYDLLADAEKYNDKVNN